jgi:hypothetical protein
MSPMLSSSSAARSVNVYRRSTQEEEGVSETWSAETPSPSLSPGLAPKVSRRQLLHSQATE